MPALGCNAVLYYDAGSDDWQPVPNVRDLTILMEAAGFDDTERDSDWKTSGPGLISAEIAWDMLWLVDDPALLAFRDAFLLGTNIRLLAMDGDLGDSDAVSQGIKMECAVTRFQRSEKQREAIFVSISAKPTIADEEPSWIEALIDIDNDEIVIDIDNGEVVVG